ncbi:biofilm PGA synthesis N-glycosyltransferase PgaC [Microbacterium sp. SORGH_AS 1204]|uniref:glycosyltransferase family 2 protein n=1 Tax=Microbacterium sp. SORGH_AS_1204 TaxID=3041785 RepID=UPI002790E927|nr:glycosyltransferase [Microbacterium sp. SORGH_AS_1204]MDQ1137941.1 biofilm PGA synthesis N-glycosyltransferase PgaC [Microbacterium sp. SORGH_AS_1204]
MTDAPSVTSRPRPSPSCPAAEHDRHVDELTAVLSDTNVHRSTIGCVVSVSDREASIAGALAALLAQTRVPDVIHVIVGDSSDATREIASELSGPHELHTELGTQCTEVFVHDIGDNPGLRAGALNYGYFLVEGCDYLLSVDGGAVAHPRAVEDLEAEALSDARIGGVSAICTVASERTTGVIARFLVAGQRAQSARSTLQNLSRRNTAVLDGPFVLFSVAALRDAMTQTRRSTPWIEGAQAGGLLLSMHIRSAGYLTRISTTARVAVKAVVTLSAYGAQQVERIGEVIDVLWPGRWGDANAQPLHPTLRVPWSENLGILAGLFVRVAFLALLAASLSVEAFVFSPWWLIPPVIAVLSNLRLTFAMQKAERTDVLFAVLGIPAEAFRWVRIVCTVRAWSRRLLPSTSRDRAVRGAAHGVGRRGAVVPTITFIAAVVALIAGWALAVPTAQSTVLRVGWAVVGVVVALQTLTMLSRLVRRADGTSV